MALKIRTVFLYVSSIVSLAAIYHLLSPSLNSSSDSLQLIHQQTPNSVQLDSVYFEPQLPNNQFAPIEIETTVTSNTTIVNLIDDYSTSILFPAWEVIVIVSSANKFDDTNYSSNHFCLFNTNETSPARFSGTLKNPDRKTYTCLLPKRVRRRLPFRQPVLTNAPDQFQIISSAPATELLRWSFIVYEITETDDDVVLFAKGINNRQGVNRSPTEFKCVFGDDKVDGVTTSVKSSLQEVFRCEYPDLTAFSQTPVKASLLMIKTNQLVPSIAYYYNNPTVAIGHAKSLLCACTMVYNVSKFLKEWVVYHSRIGVDKFILYDNGSDDDLESVVDLLISKGYDVETRFWLWPKTQEAGFSHAALLAKNSCQWMMYIDVDEFIYSPQWVKTRQSKSLLPSLLPKHPFGQVIVRCYEFGPSKQKKHPTMGVTQGYNCRKKLENRHKSIVLLDAIDDSLLNMIHHFKLKDGYKSKKLGLEKMVVNHYKYQAWPEFKAKFRRRVSAYVVDWTRSVNLKSNDRAPGVGHLAVEPEGWEDRFCEVYDNQLRNLIRRWLGLRNEQSGFRMEWQK